MVNIFRRFHIFLVNLFGRDHQEETRQPRGGTLMCANPEYIENNINSTSPPAVVDCPAQPIEAVAPSVTPWPTPVPRAQNLPAPRAQDVPAPHAQNAPVAAPRKLTPAPSSLRTSEFADFIHVDRLEEMIMQAVAIRRSPNRQRFLTAKMATTPIEVDTLKVHEFRPRSSSAGPTHLRENNGDEQVVIVNELAKITLTECAGSAEIQKTVNNNNFLKCPTVKKLTTSRSNPQLGQLAKQALEPPRKGERPLVSRGTLLKLMDIPPPDYDQIRRSLSPCRLSPEAQSLLEKY